MTLFIPFLFTLVLFTIIVGVPIFISKFSPNLSANSNSRLSQDLQSYKISGSDKKTKCGFIEECTLEDTIDMDKLQTCYENKNNEKFQKLPLFDFSIDSTVKGNYVVKEIPCQITTCKDLCVKNKGFDDTNLDGAIVSHKHDYSCYLGCKKWLDKTCHKQENNLKIPESESEFFSPIEYHMDSQEQGFKLKDRHVSRICRVKFKLNEETCDKIPATIESEDVELDNVGSLGGGAFLDCFSRYWL